MCANGLDLVLQRVEFGVAGRIKLLDRLQNLVHVLRSSDELGVAKSRFPGHGRHRHRFGNFGPPLKDVDSHRVPPWNPGVPCPPPARQRAVHAAPPPLFCFDLMSSSETNGPMPGSFPVSCVNCFRASCKSKTPLAISVPP